MRLKINVAFCSILLAVIGIVMIYSASSYAAELRFGDAFFYVKKQIFALVAGLVLMAFGARLNLDLLVKTRWIVYGISVALLLILFIPGVGQTSYGATRWINLGFMTVQSSEVAKFGLVIFLAAELDRNPPLTFGKTVLPVLAGLVVCVAIMLEPNMSVTMCVALTLVVMLIVAGLPTAAVVGCGALGAAGIPALILMEPYRVKRLLAFLDPWASPKAEGYQLIQSFYALGSGGLFGVGLFASRQKYLFLPFAESDFIFSVIGEELGLLGSIGVLGVFFVLILSGIRIALGAKDRYRFLLASGITALIAVQTLVNIAVVSGSIPPTGLPLPYVSAGGSSLMIFLFASGLLINCNRDSVQIPDVFRSTSRFRSA